MTSHAEHFHEGRCLFLDKYSTLTQQGKWAEVLVNFASQAESDLKIW